MLPLHVRNANEEIIRQPKISVQPLINWNLINIADSVANTHLIKKRNRLKFLVLSICV
jgi:hypothetical protein